MGAWKVPEAFKQAHLASFFFFFTAHFYNCISKLWCEILTALYLLVKDISYILTITLNKKKCEYSNCNSTHTNTQCQQTTSMKNDYGMVALEPWGQQNRVHERKVLRPTDCLHITLQLPQRAGSSQGTLGPSTPIREIRGVKTSAEEFLSQTNQRPPPHTAGIPEQQADYRLILEQHQSGG